MLIGAWNVRTMSNLYKLQKGKLETVGQGLGKEEMLCNELDRKKIKLAAISEHRWKGQGEYKHGDWTFLFTGTTEKDGKWNKSNGVAIVMNKAYKRVGRRADHK